MGYKSYLDDVKKQLDQAEEDTLFMIGELVAKQAKKLAPVGKIDGGTLRQKIKSRVGTHKGRRQVIIGTNVEYALYVEKGTGIHAEGGKGRKTPWQYYDPRTGRWYKTRGMKPQPFLFPAAFGNLARIKAIVKEVYGKEL